MICFELQMDTESTLTVFAIIKMDVVIGQLEYAFAYHRQRPYHETFFDTLVIFDLTHILVNSAYAVIRNGSAAQKPFRSFLKECCLQVRQDFYIAHQSDYLNRWTRTVPPFTNPHIHKMYLEDMVKKKKVVLFGFFKKESKLFKLDEPMILKKILNLTL